MKHIYLLFISIIISNCASLNNPRKGNMYLIEIASENSLCNEEQYLLLSQTKLKNGENRKIFIKNIIYYKNSIILSDYRGIFGCCSDFNFNNKNDRNKLDTLLFLENFRFKNKGKETIIKKNRIYRVAELKYCACDISYTYFSKELESKIFIYPYFLDIGKIRQSEKRILNKFYF